jgi:Tfp pilus assembly protein PilZ
MKRKTTSNKKKIPGQVQWLTSVTPTTREAEIGRTVFQATQEKNMRKIIKSKKGLGTWLKW